MDEPEELTEMMGKKIKVECFLVGAEADLYSDKFGSVRLTLYFPGGFNQNGVYVSVPACNIEYCPNKENE